MKSPQDMRIIQIDITNACMYRCSNCTRFCGHHKKNFFMDFETFKRAVESLEGYVGTIGIMGGEPTLHPEFERFMLYLNSQLPKDRKNDSDEFVYPQKDFIISRKYENRYHSIIYPYSTGKRDTVLGAGLWTAMVESYERHYEIIQDTFRMQAVNDHGNRMFHAPILFTRKDMGLSDEEWYTIRDNCWAQCEWSATITPKGAFFCEIAGALDMLFDGPGGWPIELGWWKRKPEEFGEQLNWCELCGICLGNFSRDANEGIDDMSQSMYERIKEKGSPKLKQGKYNILNIQDGRIVQEDNDGNVYEARQELFFESFDSRFDKGKCVLYPKGFQAFIVLEKNINIEPVVDAIIENSKVFEKILVVVNEEQEALIADVVDNVCTVLCSDELWGHRFLSGYLKLDDSLYTVYMTPEVVLTDIFHREMMDVILNPGTLQWCNLGEDKDITNTFIKNKGSEGIVALFNKKALSLRAIGMDKIANANGIEVLKDGWEKRKCIAFHPDAIHSWEDKKISPGKSYVLYGTGKKAERITHEFATRGARVFAYADSNERKWGTEFLDKKVLSFDELKALQNNYDGIIIASIFYNEIRETLEKQGIPDEKILLAD